MNARKRTLVGPLSAWRRRAERKAAAEREQERQRVESILGDADVREALRELLQLLDDNDMTLGCALGMDWSSPEQIRNLTEMLRDAERPMGYEGEK